MASTSFEFATAGRIRFGRGVAGGLPDLLQPLGQFVLLLTGGDAARSAPHGAICGRLLPLVIEVNVRALKERLPRSPALARYRELARLLTGDPEAKIIDGLIWLQSLCLELGLAPLARYGVSEDHVAELVEKARRASSMQGNPIKLSRVELGGVLKKEIELG